MKSACDLIATCGELKSVTQRQHYAGLCFFTGGVFVLFSSLQSCSFRVTIEINLIFGLCHYVYALRLRLRGG